jgi:RNA polymerase sigma-70 factor (ECF subfamily)
MPAIPPHSGSSGPLNSPSSERDDEGWSEFDPETQPADEAGVKDDMATLALNPRLLENLQAAETHHAVGDFGMMDDAAIMLALRDGDMAGFDFLIQKYRKPIMHFMYRMVHNQAVAEELAQEVFLRVYRSRATYRAEARFSTWLYRIATNLGVNYARDNRHERNASMVYLNAANASTLFDSTFSRCPNGNAWLFSCTSTKAWTTNRLETCSN